MPSLQQLKANITQLKQLRDSLTEIKQRVQQEGSYWRSIGREEPRECLCRLREAEMWMNDLLLVVLQYEQQAIVEQNKRNS